jgi:hypothetical protein
MTDVDPPIELNAIVKIYAESKGYEEKCQRKEARYSIVKDCMMEKTAGDADGNENKWGYIA